MAYLDGTEFIGLDGEMVNADADGDGQQVACTASVATMRSNVEFLGNEGDAVVHTQVSVRSATLSDSTVATGIRPHTSVEFTTYFSVPWIFSRGFEGFDLSLFCRVSNEDSDNGDGVFSRISAVGLKQGDAEIITSTFNGTIDNFEQVDLTFDLEEPLDRRVITDLTLEFRGLPQGSVQADRTNVDGLSGLRLKAGVSTYGYSVGIGAVPAADDPAVMVSVDNENAATNIDDSFTIFDHLRAVDDEVTMHVMPSNGTRLRGNYPDIDTFYISYIQPKSVEIRSRYDSTKFTAQLDRYRAGRVVRSSDDVELVSGVIETFTRPRCLWVGPLGVPMGGSERDAPAHYHERFKRLAGDESTTIMLYGPCEFETVNPTVSLLWNAIPYTRAYNYNFTGDTGKLREEAARSQWSVELTIEEFSGGTWSDIGSVSDTVDAYHYGTHISVDYPVLFCEWLRDKYVTLAGRKYSSGSRYCYREGQLWTGRLDQTLVQREQLSVPITYDPSSGGLCRFKLEMSRVSGSETWGEIPDFYQQATELFYMITGASLWELPAELDE